VQAAAFAAISIIVGLLDGITGEKRALFKQFFFRKLLNIFQFFLFLHYLVTFEVFLRI